MRWGSIGKGLRRTAWWLGAAGTLLLAFGLLGSWLSITVSPADFWPSALFGLMFPWLLLGNVLLIVLFLLFRPRYAMLPGAAILLCLPLLLRFFQFRATTPPSSESEDLRVMSFNVNLFKLYSWSKQPPTFNAVAELCRAQGADVICLQEFYTHDELFTPSSAKDLFGPYGHVHYVWHSQSGHYGVATFSRFPIVAKGEIRFENSMNATIFTDIKIGEDTIRIYNNHLQSFRLNRSNLEFLRNPRLNTQPETRRQIKELSQRMARAFTMRARQAKGVREHIDHSPYPVIVCGDFNDSPISYTYSVMRGALADAFRVAGVGFGPTYRGLMPSFRIDYILYSPSRLHAVDFKVHASTLSDHYPIQASFQLLPQHP